jgi:aspartyl protease family protein
MKKHKKPNKSSRTFFLGLLLLALSFSYLGTDFYFDAKHRLIELVAKIATTNVVPAPIFNPKIIKPSVKNPVKSFGIITLTADAQGHFRGFVLINDISMPFLIDTGATRTVIPEKMALKAQLPIGRKVVTHTAGGEVFAHQTQINSFNIQGVQINNLEAQINPYLHEVLIGMSTLKYFNMTLQGKSLTLVSNDFKVTSAVQLESPKSVAVKKRQSVIIKRKVCNAKNVCRTVFSDY